MERIKQELCSIVSAAEPSLLHEIIVATGNKELLNSFTSEQLKIKNSVPVDMSPVQLYDLYSTDDF